MTNNLSLTPYHARYFSLILTRRAGGVERYFPALASADIDLHPHQIDAAVFATRSSFLDSVILADEEGLGKTVEAGLVLLQAVLEGRRNLLVLCLPNLLTHWRDELDSKFSLPVITPEEAGAWDGVVVLSYQKAVRQADWLASVAWAWDVCVLDEAHLLANAGVAGHSQLVEPEKERRREEERLSLLGAEIRQKRDERIAEAARRAKCRFWDEEMFVVKFRVVDTI